jgi:AcrR family transcriptional regulator
VSATTLSAERRELMTRRLLEAVEENLGQGPSYAELSVARIIAAANIARSTFYAYFPDKGALLAAIGHDAVSAIIEASRGWSTLPPEAGRAELRAVFEHLVATYRGHASVLAAMAEAAPTDPTVRREHQRLAQVGYRELTQHADAGQQCGTVRADIEVAGTVRWLVTMVQHGLYHHTRHGDPAAMAGNIDALTGIVWHSLYAGAPARPPGANRD